MEWLQQYWDRLNRVRLQGRLPHALLISGQAGVGKRALAERFAHALLCEQPAANGRPCAHCTACGWLQAGTHPDLLWLEPDELGKVIKVDQVRALISELCMTSHTGRYKVAIVQPADDMNRNAANSLLKTLEEPTENTLLLLLTALPGRLPATIRSRCQQLQVALPDAPSAQRWLQAEGMTGDQITRYLMLANGAPLRARQLAETDSVGVRTQRLEQLLALSRAKLDPVEIAREWMGEGERQSLEWWQGWIQDIIRWQQGGRTPLEPEMAQKLQGVAGAVDCRHLFDLSDKLAVALEGLNSGLNRQLILEDLLIFWARLANLTTHRSVAGGG